MTDIHTPTPNKERIRLLVDALRSGEYQQTCELLGCEMEDGDRFCCLGVACEVAIRNGVAVRKKVDTENRSIAYDGEGLIMPPSVWSWYGFDDGNPYIFKGRDDDWCSAAECNDALGMTFTAIANAIEEHYLR